MNQFLAIDIGASSGRHILATLENGKLLLKEIYRFPNRPIEREGELIWDADRLFSEILAGMKRAGELGYRPVSVGIDTWAVDYALLDADFKRIGNVVSYRSERTKAVIPSVHGTLPFASLYAKTGIQFQPFNTVYQLACDRASGKLAGAAHLLMLPDYFHFLLTGKLSREYTNATSTGLVNASTHRWDGEILRGLGYPEALFPETSQPGTLLGPVKPEIAREIGYGCNVVLPATHDTASAVVASLAEGGLYLSSGTWSLLGTVQPVAHTDEKSRLFNYSNEGHLGGNVRLQKNIMGLWIIQRIREEIAPDLSFAALSQLAAEHPTDARINVNDERFLSPKNMTREVEAALGKALPLGELAYCVFASLAESYREAVEELSSVTGKKYTALNVIGGGCQNKLLNVLTAEATGLTVIAGPVEATALGNLLVQMAAAGELSLRDAPELLKKSFETEIIKP